MNKNNIKDDYILIVVAILLLILSGFLFFWFSPGQSLPLSPAPRIIGESSLTIDFGNGEKRVFKGKVVENENLLNVLSQAAKAGNLRFKLNEENNVDAIETFAADKSKMWQWSVNGKKIEKQFYEIIVKPNDEIFVKYGQK